MILIRNKQNRSVMLSDRRGIGIGGVVLMMVVMGGMGRLEQGRTETLAIERDAFEFSGQTGCF